MECWKPPVAEGLAQVRTDHYHSSRFFHGYLVRANSADDYAQLAYLLRLDPRQSIAKNVLLRNHMLWKLPCRRNRMHDTMTFLGVK